MGPDAILANTICIGRTYAVYLAVALPLCALLLLVLRRPVIAGIVGSTLAMALTSIFKSYLPCDYWAHANDFIIEQFTPFLVPNATFEPFEALVSLLFHVGIPVVMVWLLSRSLRPRKRPTETERE